MTVHPCRAKKLTPRQIETFEQIAIGNPLPHASKQTYEKLEVLGLIVRTRPIVKADRFGKYEIPQYGVPIHHHAAWCAWCSEQEK